MSPAEPVTGLILSGGGARAAYQVGVLAAIAELLPLGADNPFPVIVGTLGRGDQRGQPGQRRHRFSRRHRTPHPVLAGLSQPSRAAQ